MGHDDSGLTAFERKLREWERADAAQRVEWADLIPEVEPTFTATGHAAELSARIEAMRGDPIAEVYDKLVGGERDTRTSGHVTMQCPMASHPDRNPSASMNLDTNVWYCHGPCEVGGSVFDLAGAAWGYALPLRGSEAWEVMKRYAKHLHGFDYEAELATASEASGQITNDDAQVLGQSPADQPQSKFEFDVEAEVYRITVRETARVRARLAVSQGEHDRLDLSYTFEDLLSEPDEEIRYSVDRMALLGTTTVILGDSKTGKTETVMSLIKSFVDEVPFYGEFKTRPLEGNLAYLNFEVDRHSSKRRFQTLGLTNTRKFRPISLRGKRFDLANPTTMKEAAAQLEMNEIEVLILDPWRCVFGGDDENSAGQVSVYTDLIDQLKERSGTVVDIFMPVHTQKNPDRFKESARGSSVVENWADASWIYRKDQQPDGTYDRFFRLGVGRDSDQEDLMRYRRVVKDPFGLLRLETPGTRTIGSDDQKVLDFVSANPGCCKADVRRGCGLEHKLCMTIIGQLVASGHLYCIPASKRGLKDELYVR